MDSERSPENNSSSYTCGNDDLRLEKNTKEVTFQMIVFYVEF